MSEQRTEGQEQERGQGSATLSKEQIELIGTILEPRFDKVEDRFDKVEDRFDKVEDRFDKVIAEMRLIAKEEGEKVRASMDTAVKDLRAEMKDDMRRQSTLFCWFIGILVTIGLAAGGLAVHKWPQAVPVAAVAPAAPVAQVAPVTPAEPAGLNEP